MIFGESVENIAASEDNPLKRGIFIRKTNAKMAEYATKEGINSTPLDNLRAIACPAPRSEVQTAIAWHACDDRYPYIRGIVTTQQETVDAWSEAGVKFEALAPVCAAQASLDREAVTNAIIDNMQRLNGLNAAVDAIMALALPSAKGK